MEQRFSTFYGLKRLTDWVSIAKYNGSRNPTSRFGDFSGLFNLFALSYQQRNCEYVKKRERERDLMNVTLWWFSKFIWLNLILVARMEVKNLKKKKKIWYLSLILKKKKKMRIRYLSLTEKGIWFLKK